VPPPGAVAHRSDLDVIDVSQTPAFYALRTLTVALDDTGHEEIERVRNERRSTRETSTVERRSIWRQRRRIEDRHPPLHSGSDGGPELFGAEVRQAERVASDPGRDRRSFVAPGGGVRAQSVKDRDRFQVRS
jgi:hypothetical protein